jgi:hypothetical protein
MKSAARMRARLPSATPLLGRWGAGLDPNNTTKAAAANLANPERSHVKLPRVNEEAPAAKPPASKAMTYDLQSRPLPHRRQPRAVKRARWVFASIYAREETRESRGMAHLFLNTEQGFGRQNNPRSLDLRGFSRHLGPKMPGKTFLTALQGSERPTWLGSAAFSRATLWNSSWLSSGERPGPNFPLNGMTRT